MIKIRKTGFWHCVIYLFVIGITSNFWGQAIPRKMFKYEKFPYASFKWENNGRIYEKLAIRKWKDKVPDMSKISKRMVKKKFDISSTSDSLLSLLYETCVAEFVHAVLIILGLVCADIWQGVGGKIIVIIWIVLGNLPYIIIQRYNRPKILKVYKKMSKLENDGKRWLKYENTNFNV